MTPMDAVIRASSKFIPLAAGVWDGNKKNKKIQAKFSSIAHQIDLIATNLPGVIQMPSLFSESGG